VKIKNIAFVGIPVTDMKRAREFYEGVLGFGRGRHARDWERRDQWKPSADRTSVAIEMENFDEAIKRLKDRHVRFAAEPFESPCCHMAVVQDPDGNKLIIHKLKPENEKEPCP
jgi:predicted enzyme related to lactoylglutathione lyase